MAVHSNHEIRSRWKVAVHRSHPNASRSRDVTYWRLDPGRDEHSGGGFEQRLLVALRVGPCLSGWLPRSLVDSGHRFISSLTQPEIHSYIRKVTPMARWAKRYFQSPSRFRNVLDLISF
jgi:hypothetical protein